MNKEKKSLLFTSVVILLIGLFLIVLSSIFALEIFYGFNAFATLDENKTDESIPLEIQNNAKRWSEGTISDNEFVLSLELLIEREIILTNYENEESQSKINIIPDWVRHNAKWWSEGTISNNEFLNSVEFLINNNIIQINTLDVKLESLLQKRQNLIDFIWKENVFPSRLPDSIEYDIIDKKFQSMPNLKKIDKITIEMKHDVNSIAYLLHPKENLQKDLMIYHNGHGQYLHDGESQIRFLIDQGYTVLVFSMPLYGINNQPDLLLDDKQIKINTHDDFYLLESDKFSPISYFLEPIIVSLNFVDKNFNFEDYHMMGISGGGWTAVLYPAIDPRISHSYSVAGSIPIELKTHVRDTGDYEQTLPELYEIANYYDLYVLASLGEKRKLVQIFNEGDPCCFDSKKLDLNYEEKIRNRLVNFNGEFEIVTTPNNIHSISGTTVVFIFLDIDEKNIEYHKNLTRILENNDFSSTTLTKLVSPQVINANLVDVQIIDANFSNKILTGNNFFSSYFYNVDLTNSDISNSDFSESTMCSSKLNNTIIHNVDFSNAFLVGIDFSNSDLKNIKFKNTGCLMCNFEGIDISEIKTGENDSGFSDFAGSNFKKIDFRGLEHEKFDFSGKYAYGCDITTPIMFVSADLTGSNFSGVDMKNIVFARSEYTQNIINLVDVDFSFADLSNANLINANLSNANLSNANLSNANLSNADLSCHNHPICNNQ